MRFTSEDFAHEECAVCETELPWVEYMNNDWSCINPDGKGRIHKACCKECRIYAAPKDCPCCREGGTRHPDSDPTDFCEFHGAEEFDLEEMNP